MCRGATLFAEHCVVSGYITLSKSLAGYHKNSPAGISNGIHVKRTEIFLKFFIFSIFYRSYRKIPVLVLGSYQILPIKIDLDTGWEKLKIDSRMIIS